MSIKAKKLQDSKVKAVEMTKAVFQNYNDYIFADYRGLTVEQISALRKQLREKNATFKIVKNTFARIAFSKMHIDSVADYLKGPTAVALATEDANEVAKILFDFAKDTPALQVKGAFVEKELYDAAKIEAFAKLPGKKQLIAMIASAINAPVQKLAATIQAYIEKKEAEGAAPAGTQVSAEADGGKAVPAEAETTSAPAESAGE